MSNKKKMGAFAAAITATLALSGPAFAGTGVDGAGVVDGENAAYCDAAAFAVNKTDAISGDALAGATFSFANNGDQLIGMKLYDTNPTESQLATDRGTWETTFNSAIESAFGETTLGQAWETARVTEDDSVLFPQNLAGITAPSVQKSLMANWVVQAAGEGYNSVDGFAQALNERYIAISDVAGDDALTGTTLAARDIEEDNLTPQAQLALAEEAYVQLLAAVVAAGYPNAAYAIDGTIAEGEYDGTAIDYEAFMTAYNAFANADAYPFGIGGATYDVIYNAIGADAVETAIGTANAAVDATGVEGESVLTDTTDANGQIWIGTFGRSITENEGTLTTDCTHMAVTITETEAPEGYILPTDGTQTINYTGDVEDALGGTFELPNQPESLDNDTPGGVTTSTPEFESGI